MHLEEVVQYMQETRDVIPVAMKLGLPDIIHNHVPDFFGAVLCAQQGTDKAGCNNFRDALVSCDDEHHFLCCPAECNAIFQRDHISIVEQKLLRCKMIKCRSKPR